MNWYKLGQTVPQRWAGIRFINPLDGKETSGVFDAIMPSGMNKGKARVRIGNMTGRPLVVPLESISVIDESIELQVGQMVQLPNYPTESPAKVLKKLDNGKYLLLPQTNRQMTLPLSEIVA